MTTELENVDSNNTNENGQLIKSVDVNDTQLVEIIENKFNKELSPRLRKLVIESRKSYKHTGTMIAELMTVAVNEEKFTKEQAKTIVSLITNMSIRTVERWTPTELKDPKFISKDKRALSDEDGNAEEGNEDFNRRKEEQENDPKIDPSTGGAEPEEEKKNATIRGLNATIKKLTTLIKEANRKRKEEHEITLLGKTAKIFTEYKAGIDTDHNKVTPEIEIKYSETDLARAFRAK